MSIIFSGCSWAQSIPEGVYRGDNPFIELTFDYSVIESTSILPSGEKFISQETKEPKIQKLEYDGKIHEVECLSGYDQTLTFIDPKLYDEFEDTDMATICCLKYYLYDNNKTMVLKDKNTDETIYVLNKVN